MTFVDFSNPYSVIIVVALLVYFAWALFKPKKEKHDMNHPGKKELPKIFKDNLDSMLKFLGAPMNNEIWYNAYPLIKIKRVAYIKKIDNQEQIEEWNALTEAEKNKVKAKGEKEPVVIERDYIVLKGYVPGLINSLLFMLGIGSIRILVGYDQVEKRHHTFYIKEGLTPFEYGKVWVVDKLGKAKLEDIAWKWATEDILEQQVNFSKRVSYLAPQLGSSIAHAEAKADIEKAKYEGIKNKRYN